MAAACGGLEQIFEKPLPPWDRHSFTQIFDHNYHSSSSSSSSNGIEKHKRSDSASSLNSSECISTCTEELCFDDDFLKNDQNYYENDKKTAADYEKYWSCESKRCSRKDFGGLPPPISCLGRNGKPWVFFKSIRKDGRFILKEIRIPTQEFLHACRKNGRLKMHFIHSDDEILDEDDNADEDTGDI